MGPDVTTETTEDDPNDVAAQKAVRAFVDTARGQLDNEALGITMVSFGAALMVTANGPEAAIASLRKIIKRLRKA